MSLTRTERAANGDPRLSLEERYGSHESYVRRAEQAVRHLVAERLLLDQDGEEILARARSPEVGKRFSREAH